MRFILDTHVLLWYMFGDARLTQNIIHEVENASNQLFISKASLWEIAIKISTGKLKLNMPIIELENYLERKKIKELSFDFKDLEYLSKLPFYHNDPFDRLIIAQAITRDISVITDDRKFLSYPVQLY